MPRNTLTAIVTAFGQTREIALGHYGDLDTASTLTSVSSAVVGKFPTGSKLHPTQLRLHKRDRGVHPVTGAPLRPLRGETAAVINGVEWVAGFTLYTHNRNVGRIVGWNENIADADLARW